MNELIEFLQARIAEDEEIATAAAESVNDASHENRGESAGPSWTAEHGMVFGQLDKDGYPTSLWDDEGSETLQMAPDAAMHVTRHDPARVLAECAAKRVIIEECLNILDVDGWEYDDAPDLASSTLGSLAAVYADHPDYRKEWVPAE